MNTSNNRIETTYEDRTLTPPVSVLGETEKIWNINYHFNNREPHTAQLYEGPCEENINQDCTPQEIIEYDNAYDRPTNTCPRMYCLR